MTSPARQRHATIQVLKPDYSGRIGTIADFESVSVTWQRLGIGTGSLSVPASSGPALQLLAANTVPVPVIVSAPGFPRWTGRVQTATASGGKKRVAQIEATFVDDRKWLQKILAVPVPGAGFGAQTVEHDVRTGPLVTVAKAYIAANIARLDAEYTARFGAGTPLTVVPVQGADTSPTVTLRARNVPLQSLLVDALRMQGYDLLANLWVPGNPQPPGLALSVPTIVVDVRKGRERPYVHFTQANGGVATWDVGVTHPEALSVLVMGQGEGIERRFLKVTNTDQVQAAAGRWGYPEDTLEATDVDTDAELTQRGVEKLQELAGTSAISLELDDRRPWTAGLTNGDYWVGDRVRASFPGVTVTDYIDRLTVTENNGGFKVSPQFGSARDTESPDVQLARSVAQVRGELALMQSRR